MIRTGVFISVFAALFTMAAIGVGNAQQSQSKIGLPCGAGFVHQGPSPYLKKASFRNANLTAGQLRIDFAGHSTFLITSPEGVKVATDYNDFFRAETLPDIATMSAWHRNHTTDVIDPSIRYVLRGWDTGAGFPRFNVSIRDLRVYSVPVNLSRDGPFFRYPTSVFVIESHGICVAHLGLLGHAIEARTQAEIGRIDILLTPIDQRVSQSFEEIIHNIKLLRPKIVMPMHYNAAFTVEGFLEQAKDHFPIKRPGKQALIAEKSKLPNRTEIHYMRPPNFSDGF